MRRRHEPEISTNVARIEAFSDGVFAIAITLLILDIRIPHMPPAESGTHLQRAILDLWPAYFAYAFTFLTIGIYWANHHYIFKLYKSTNHQFNLLNVFFLMCVAFLPLPTATLGQYMQDPNKCQTAIEFYILGLWLPALAWCVCWLYAVHGYRLIDKRLEPNFVRHLTRQYVFSLIIYTVGLGIAVWSGGIGLLLTFGLTLLYLMPPRKPIYIDDEAPANG